MQEKSLLFTNILPNLYLCQNPTEDVAMAPLGKYRKPRAVWVLTKKVLTSP
jgi:hypothetical protein